MNAHRALPRTRMNCGHALALVLVALAGPAIAAGPPVAPPPATAALHLPPPMPAPAKPHNPFEPVAAPTPVSTADLPPLDRIPSGPALPGPDARLLGTVNGVSVYEVPDGCYLYRKNGKWSHSACLDDYRQRLFNGPADPAKR